MGNNIFVCLLVVSVALLLLFTGCNPPLTGTLSVTVINPIPLGRATIKEGDNQLLNFIFNSAPMIVTKTTTLSPGMHDIKYECSTALGIVTASGTVTVNVNAGLTTDVDILCNG